MTEGHADLLVQSLTDYAIYMLDPAGMVSSWNAGAERLKGYTADEIIGQHFSKFHTEADRAGGLPDRALRTALEQGRFEAEGWRMRKDGTRFWADVVVEPIRDSKGRHIGFAKITCDRTERREAEQALRHSEERFRLLVQGVTDYAIYMLDPGGHVTSWNAGAERFKGYTADEIIGSHFSRFYPLEDREAGTPWRALEIAEREGRFEAEGWRMRKDGSRFWANVVIDPIHDDSGTLIGFTKITRDLTERKQSNEALEKAREQFFQSQKLEAIGKLTGGVAHDFNNILAAIIGSINLARRRAAAGLDNAQFLENAVQAAERGALLTQRMLAFARKQELKLEPVDVLACVRDMANILERTIGPQVGIEVQFPLSVSPVLADRTQLELAIMNLVVNARDAMPKGGAITISAREEEGVVCLTVADDGEGMEADTLSHAIEPFFTTKGVGKGTGLGLSMVQGMVEQCGGRLTIDSAPGAGTRVELRLPAADKLAQVPVPVRVEADRTTPSLRILAVDDDPLVLLNTATVLQDMGHEVIEATSGEAALRAIEDAEIDLLLTDFAMPGMTGAELIAALRKKHPDLKAVLATGYADLPEGHHVDAPRLAKPFTDQQLQATIAGVMEAKAA
jgi:PAS domain S-box-containing protein